MRIDKNGWLVRDEADPPIKQYPTVRTMPLAKPKPLGIVWHWTAGRGGPGFAEKLASSIQTYQRGIDRPASWHVLVAKDGTLFQSAPFLVGRWHVGKDGVIAGERFDNINHATIGCELENAGRLHQIKDHYYCWPYWVNPEAPASELRPSQGYLIEDKRVAVVPDGGAFDAFTPAQVTSATVLLRALAAAYGWTRAVSAYGHVDFAFPQKEDPGALWKVEHLPRILDAVFGDAPQIAP